MVKIIAFTSLFVAINFLPMVSKAQHITIDKDGYTNIREEPNSKSKIVGKVLKNQIFYLIDDTLDGLGENDDIPKETADWILISTEWWNPNRYSGYIYKKYAYPLSDMTILKGDGFGKSIITCSNKDIKVTMITQPFVKGNHTISEEPFNVDGRHPYGIDGLIQHLHREIKQIEVVFKGKQFILSKDKIANYYNPNSMDVYIGPNEELYIRISGGDGAGGYSVYLSVVNGKIVSTSLNEV